MKKKKKIIAIALLLTINIALIGSIFVYYNNDRPITPAKENIAQNEEEKPLKDNFRSKEMADIYEINNDVVGWLKVEGTDIDEPVVQGSDNDKYLRRKVESSEWDLWGCLFMDWINGTQGNPLMQDKVTIIYGHSYLDEADNLLFSQLKRYKEESFARTNPTFTFKLLNDDAKRTYKIFACSDMPISIDYIDPNPNEEKYQETLDYILSASYVDFGVNVTTDDKIMILSTCTSNPDYRYIIAAVPVEQ